MNHSGEPLISIIDNAQADASEAIKSLRKLLSPDGNVVSEKSRQKTIELFGEPLSPAEVVEKICLDVKEQGSSAVLGYLQKIDGANLTTETLRVPAEEIQAAHAQADSSFLKTVRTIRDNIFEFQTKILHQNVKLERPAGSYLEQKYCPLNRVGICVPGGAAAYPSTVLMTAVPAEAAGVKQRVVIAPPTPFGAYNQDLLAVCHELGISEIYRMGGAQGVAALAYGIENIPAVDKVVGPGNLFVALAKKQVYGDVDIDSIAGPSEVVIVADDSAPAHYLAIDMLSQAEHSPGASILITPSQQLANATAKELKRQVRELERAKLTETSLKQYGAIIICSNLEEACKLADQFAPEHLQVSTKNAATTAEQIRHAGAVFLGNYSPVALGDYAAGPSHVLPTSGTARWAHGLCSNDFLRSHSVIHYTQEALADLEPVISNLATTEGLTAHRQSVQIRQA